MNEEAGPSKNHKNETKNCELFLRRAFKAYKAEIQEYQSQIDNLNAAQTTTREPYKCNKCEDLQKSLQELQQLLKTSREELNEKDKIIANLQSQLREKSLATASTQKIVVTRRNNPGYKRAMSSDEESGNEQNLANKKLKRNDLKRTESRTIKSKPSITVIPETLDIDMGYVGVSNSAKVLVPETLDIINMDPEDHSDTTRVLVPETLDVRLETEDRDKVLVPETLDIELDRRKGNSRRTASPVVIQETLSIEFPDCMDVNGSKSCGNGPLVPKTTSRRPAANQDENKAARRQRIPIATSTPEKQNKLVTNRVTNDKTNDVTCPKANIPTESPRLVRVAPELPRSIQNPANEQPDKDVGNLNKSLNDTADFLEAAFVNVNKNKLQREKSKPARRNLKSAAKKSTKAAVQIDPKKPGHKSPKMIQTKINKDTFTKRRTALDKDLLTAISESLKDSDKPPANNENATEDVCILEEPSTSGCNVNSAITVLCDDCSSNDSEDLLAEIGAASPQKQNGEEVKTPVQMDQQPGRLGYYDKVPEKGGPSYKYKHDPIRRKEERAKLNGENCAECEKYNEALPDGLKDKQLKTCSRHKDIYHAPSTPVHFWSPNFPSTPECIERGYQKSKTAT